ncbi:MAG: tetratricopeptide repeat protein [Bryobacteraceae bacterium]
MGLRPLRVMKLIGLFLITYVALMAGAPATDFERAKDLYQRTDYAGALRILLPIGDKNPGVWSLIGQSYFMDGEYKKATEAFDKAVMAEPNNSEYVHWLGRAYGRRAEMASPFTALGHASKTRQLFERAVVLDPHNGEALNDLFDYYLNAPGFLGGGSGKAEQLIQKIEKVDPAEGQYARAQLAEKQKDFTKAEVYFRKAIELAPKQVGRLLDLGKFLAMRGRLTEADSAFQQAAHIAPEDPRVMFTRAEVLIKANQNLEEAKKLLRQYLRCRLSPDDPPREKAQELLKKIGA